MFSKPPFISHEWPFGRGTNLLGGLIKHGSSLLTNWDDPSMEPDNIHKFQNGWLQGWAPTIAISRVIYVISPFIRLK